MKKLNWVICLSALSFALVSCHSGSGQNFSPAKTPGSSPAPQGKNRSTLNSELYVAVLHGDLEKTRTLLNQGADPNTTGGNNSDSVMTLAAKGGHPEIARLLASKGAKIDPAGNHPTVPFSILEHYSSLNAPQDSLGGSANPQIFQGPSASLTSQQVLDADFKTFDEMLTLGSKLSYVGGSSDDGVHYHSLFELAIEADLKLAERGVFKGFTEDLVKHGFKINLLQGTKASDMVAPGFETVWVIRNVSKLRMDNPVKRLVTHSLVKSLVQAGLNFSSVTEGVSGLSEAMADLDRATFRDIFPLIQPASLDFAHLGSHSPLLGLAYLGENDACQMAVQGISGETHDLQGRTGTQCFSDILSNLEFYIDQTYHPYPEKQAREALNAMANQVSYDLLYTGQSPLSAQLTALGTDGFSPRLTELLVILGADLNQAIQLQQAHGVRDVASLRGELEKQLSPEVDSILEGKASGKSLWEELNEYRQRWKRATR